jgi:formylglycine-generating enzyme required for sulfatase activity
MTYCLNPACPNPDNPEQNRFCETCGTELRKIYLFRTHYQIIKKLGQGAFGRTYLAKDTDLMGEFRVIKKLTAQGEGSARQKAQELFQREANQLYYLNHPQIPKLYAYFEQNNALYLVQEFIRGEDLFQEFKKQGQFSEQKVILVLQELLPVLDYIHQQNVLHRDIKPENIMRPNQAAYANVTNSKSKLVVIDFGGAKQTNNSQSSAPATVIYTPGYAAIEHMIGQPCAASDLYSLGATCARLLTGCFPQPDEQGNYKDDLYDQINLCWKWQEVLQRQGIKVSERLAKVLDKLLESSAKNRYQSAQEVLEDLNPTVKSPVQFTPPVTVSPPVSQNLTPTATPVKQTPTPSSNLIIPQTKRFKFETVTLELTKAWFSNKLNIKTLTKKSAADYITLQLGGGVTLDLVAIPGGKFIMGSPPNEKERQETESPQHEVTIPSFYLGKYPVTQAQWKAVMKSNPSRYKKDDHPVELVSWEKCQEFCEKVTLLTGLSVRLPSESEWEYGCRGGTFTPFYFGETITSDVANYQGTSSYNLENYQSEVRGKTTPVGSFPANPFGLYDMAGNVWEWCADNWHNNYQNAPSDGNPWLESNSKYYLIRGGSWKHSSKSCRSACRFGPLPSDFLDVYLGFRLALTL